ncbi:hypothetical protein JW968_04145 [Candidatus Woesearchaeota archaeon]|nr:hypothetical protein [Candidatus Woesearchaeota archaeon]
MVVKIQIFIYPPKFVYPMQSRFIQRLTSGDYNRPGFMISDFFHAYLGSLKRAWTTVYSGTTEENFQTCAFRTRFGNILFDKSLESAHHYDELYYSPRFGSAAVFGMQSAESIGHTPLVMEGRCLEDEIVMVGTLPKGEAFFVDAIWRISDADWLKTFQSRDGSEKWREHYSRYDPSILIRK